jgi:hypothetical protein
MQWRTTLLLVTGFFKDLWKMRLEHLGVPVDHWDPVWWKELLKLRQQAGHIRCFDDKRLFCRYPESKADHFPKSFLQRLEFRDCDFNLGRQVREKGLGGIMQNCLNLSHNGFLAEQVGDVKAVFCNRVMLVAGTVESAVVREVVSNVAYVYFFGFWVQDVELRAAWQEYPVTLSLPRSGNLWDHFCAHSRNSSRHYLEEDQFHSLEYPAVFG